MTHIDKSEFGRITIDGKTYSEDVKILPEGKILKRWGPKDSHAICLEEFTEMLKEKPEVIVIGTGTSGLAELETEARTEIEKHKIKIIEAKTPKAADSFNKIKQRKAGLFHLTC